VTPPIPTPPPLDAGSVAPVIQQLASAATSLSISQVGMAILVLLLVWGAFELLWHVIDLHSS